MKKIFFVGLMLFSLVFSSDYAEILKNQNIKIGVSPNMPPFSKLSGGNFDGFEIEFAKELIGKIFQQGMKITFVPIEQSKRLEAVKQNQVDILIAAYTQNEQRAKQVDFSMPYFSIILALTSKKSQGIKTEADLKGKKIAAIENTNSDIYLKQKGYSVVYCKDNKDCWDKVKSDEAIGFMHNIVSTATIPILDSEFENSIKFGNLAYMDCVVTQKGNKSLVEKINKAIMDLSKDGFFKKKYEETFVPFYRGTLDKKYFILDDIYSLMF